MWSKLKRKRSVKTLFTLSFDVTLRNVSCYCADDSLKYLTQKIKGQLLKSLTVNCSFWRQTNFKNILNLLIHPKLEMLDITSAHVDDEILKILSICKELQKIYLIRDGSYSISKQVLLNFLQYQTHLKILQLRNCDIVDDSVLECISENCQKIDSLDIKGCKEISDRGLKTLSSLKDLTSITLSKTKITNDGLIEYIKGPSGRKLKELIVDNCIYIDVRGLQAVPKYCPNLEIFVFYNCDCSEDMAMQYLEHRDLKNLKQLTWTVAW